MSGVQLVTIEGCEPMELLREPIKQKVWIRVIESDSYWPEIEIRGEQEEIYSFITQYWGDEDVAQYAVFGNGPLAPDE